MNEVDWVICCVMGISALVSLFRGFVKEAISLLLWLFAFGLAIGLSGKMAQLLIDWISQPPVRQIVAFAILFFSTLIVGGLVGQLFSALIKKAGLGAFDRLLGMAFGAVRGAVIVLVVIMVIPYVLSVEGQAWWNESKLIPEFLMMEDWALKVLGDVNAWRMNIIEASQ